jgi:hypothetical protein
MINKNVFRKLLPDNPKKWSIFSVCTLIASVFWVFLTFSKSDEHSLDFSLEYAGQPSNQVLVNNPASQVKVKVRGRGFDLFYNSSWLKEKIISVDVSQFSKVQKGSMTSYTLNLAKGGNELLKDELRQLKAVGFSVDNLTLIFDEVISKKLFVDADVDIKVDSSLYVVDRFQLIPDSVFVTGSKYLLSEMNSISTVSMSVEASGKKSQYALAIKKPKGVLELGHDSVKYNLSLLSYETYTLSVPVKCATCPDSLTVKIFPSYAEVSFTATAADFKNIKPGDFSILVDYHEIEKSSEKLFIKLAEFPEGLNQSKLKLSPAKAEYLVRENR